MDFHGENHGFLPFFLSKRAISCFLRLRQLLKWCNERRSSSPISGSRAGRA